MLVAGAEYSKPRLVLSPINAPPQLPLDNHRPYQVPCRTIYTVTYAMQAKNRKKQITIPLIKVPFAL